MPIAGPSATLIYDDWYPALRTSTLRKGKLATAMLLDIPLVLGRLKSGKLFAMRDSCPHRGIPLSYGWFDGERVTCRYHGWEFEPCSRAVRADSFAYFARSAGCDADLRQRVSLRGARRACVGLCSRSGKRKTFAGRAGAGGAGAEEVWPAIPDGAPPADLPCNVDHGIIGLMDPAHGPFVHQAWWWRSRASHSRKDEEV